MTVESTSNDVASPQLPGKGRSNRPGTAALVREEHDRIRELIASLENQVRALTSEPPRHDGMTPAQFEQALVQLRSVSKMHFRREEAAMYPELAESSPRLTVLLDGLASEHAQILQGLDASISRARAAPNVTDDSATADELRGVLRLIRRHEAREREVMFQADWNDLGRGA